MKNLKQPAANDSEFTILEYVWLDGYKTPNLRSKIRTMRNWTGETPLWNFDGSSTKQAPGASSECILQPVRNYRYSDKHYIVLCEVLDANGVTHVSNKRASLNNSLALLDTDTFWWGFEQEYFITVNGKPLGFPSDGYPEPQGLYYCGVGGNQVKGRPLVEAHLKKCLSSGINLTGVNAEVAIGQWEFQCFATDTLKACDDLWISRYMLYKMCEENGWDINIDPKPIRGDWNGSGCHTNFSNFHMRNVGGKEYFEKVFESFEKRHDKHIAGYGLGNENRLTGDHETQHISKFSWGVADRGSSIRVPTSTAELWKGYVEDRRPASNCDPYVVAKLIVDAMAGF